MKENDINLHVVAVFSWIRNGEKYLLARRSADDPQAGGLWALVGGKVDLDKGNGIIEETLKREIEEEVGILVEDEFRYLSSQGFVRSSGHHVVSLIFEALYKSGEEQALDGQEEVRWMTIPEIEDLINSDKRIEYLRASFKKLQES